MLLFVPILPLRSLRLKRGRTDFFQPALERPQFPIVSSEHSYEVYKQARPDLRQVACVYLFTAFYLAWSASASWLPIEHMPWAFEGAGRIIGYPLELAGLGAPFLLPLFLRSRARRR